MEREEYNRIRKLDSLIRFVDKKLTDEDNHKTFLLSLGANGEEMLAIEKGLLTRQQGLPKKVNEIIDVFVENEFSNYYNIDNVLKGKVKAFQGATPKARMIAALEYAKQYHG